MNTNLYTKESRSGVMIQQINTPSRKSNEIIKKSCLDCNTTKTPCWRGGPSGPRTLCNACGIRYRKKRRGLLGLKNKRSSSVSEKRSSTKTSDDDRDNDTTKSLKMGYLEFGRRDYEEEQQAALLLMAMSCGSVYA